MYPACSDTIRQVPAYSDESGDRATIDGIGDVEWQMVAIGISTFFAFWVGGGLLKLTQTTQCTQCTTNSNNMILFNGCVISNKEENTNKNENANPIESVAQKLNKAKNLA
eukprot:5396089-Ditylum_brightwellii.AAC.1